MDACALALLRKARVRPCGKRTQFLTLDCLQTALETRDAARSTVAALHEQEVQMHKLQDQYAEVSTVTSGTGAMHCSIPVTKKPW